MELSSRPGAYSKCGRRYGAERIPVASGFLEKKDVAGILLMPPLGHFILRLNDSCKRTLRKTVDSVEGVIFDDQDLIPKWIEFLNDL